MKLINIILLIIIFILVILLEKKHTTGKETPEDTPQKNYPYKKKLILTKTEYKFYNILKPLCDNANLIICPKMRMEDFLDVTDKENKQKYRGYIKSRHIDFIMCDSKLHMLAGIELDDNSHQREAAKQTDEFKNEVFKTINLPLYRIKVTDNMYEEQIKTIISELTHNQ